MRLSRFFMALPVALPVALPLALTAAALLWGCPDEGGKKAPAKDMMVEEPDARVFPDMGGGEEADVVDMEPTEPATCARDEECFAGRICATGACAAAECQTSEGCPAERPSCFGPEGDEPGQRRGRCGSCATDVDCYGAATCVPFEGAASADGEAAGGLCALEGACEGTLECPPASRLVVRGDALGAATSDGGQVSQVCVDRRDTNRDPVCDAAFDCREGDECPEGLSCLPSGQCGAAPLGAGCEERAQCGFGDVCRRDGVCGPCDVDSECARNQVCAAGRCAEVPGACTGDGECLDGRRCVLGECAAPECAEDALGAHPTLAEALDVDGDRVYRGLVSCVDDFFRFTLPPGTSALVAVRQRDRGANLGVQVLDAEGREVGRGVGPAPVEGVRVLESAAPRALFVRVFQEGPRSTAEYDLELHFAEAGEGVCFDDPFELSGGDDAAETARLVRASAASPFPDVVRGQICPGDLDVLCFEMGRNERLTVKGRVEVGDALITGALLDPQGGEVEGARGQWAPDLNAVDIDLTVQQRGRYCLRLSSDASDPRRLGQGRYALELNAVSPALAGLCGAAERLTLEQQRGGALGELQGDDVLRASCAPDSDSPERAYSVDATAPSLLVARVSGVSAGTLGAPVLSLRAQCDQSSSELACSARSFDVNNPFITPPNPAVLRAPLNPPVDPVTGVAAGRYTLLVDGVVAGERPSFQVDVELRPLAPPPVNDTCERVEALAFVGGVAVVEASLDQAGADVATCGEGGPDVVYSFTLAERSFVTIQAASKPAEFPVVVSLSDRCGGAPVACGFGAEVLLEAGEHHVTLAGVDTHSRGLAELQVSARPAARAPANEVCASAQALAGASGVAQGDTSGARDDYAMSRQNVCTRDNTTGPDVVFSLPVSAGVPVTLTLEPAEGWDAALYLLTACEGSVESSCVAGQDGALTETLRYTPTQTGALYVVVDGASGESGPFSLRWQTGE